MLIEKTEMFNTVRDEATSIPQMRNKIDSIPLRVTLLTRKEKILAFYFPHSAIASPSTEFCSQGHGCGTWLCERGGYSSPKLLEFQGMEGVQSALLLSCCSSLELCSNCSVAWLPQEPHGIQRHQGAPWEPLFSWAASTNSRHREGREGTGRNQRAFVFQPSLPSSVLLSSAHHSTFAIPLDGTSVPVTASAFGKVVVFQVIEWIMKKEMLPCIMWFLNGNSLLQV